jgi:hypothetical protein
MINVGNSYVYLYKKNDRTNANIFLLLKATSGNSTENLPLERHLSLAEVRNESSINIQALRIMQCIPNIIILKGEESIQN